MKEKNPNLYCAAMIDQDRRIGGDPVGYSCANLATRAYTMLLEGFPIYFPVCNQCAALLESDPNRISFLVTTEVTPEQTARTVEVVPTENWQRPPEIKSEVEQDVDAELKQADPYFQMTAPGALEGVKEFWIKMDEAILKQAKERLEPYRRFIISSDSLTEPQADSPVIVKGQADGTSQN